MNNDNSEFWNIVTACEVGGTLLRPDLAQKQLAEMESR
jgi:hypothetical protein